MKQLLQTAIISLFFVQAVGQTPQNGLQFNGGNAHVTVPNLSATLTTNTSFSMAGWVLPTNATTGFPNFDGIFGFRNESNFDFYILQLSATNYEARFRNGNNQVFTINSPTVQVNAWQHVALVYTGTALEFYHNGALASSIAANGTINNNNVTFFMGKLPFQNLNFEYNGRMDDVALWNRSLTAAEVLCLYEQAIDTSMAGLTAYYPMNQGVAGGNNTSITNVTDAIAGANGVFNNMGRNGSTNNFLAGINKMTQYVDTICKGGAYNFGNQTFTDPGVYTFYASNADGCDSLIELTLVSDSVDVGVFQNGLMLTAALAGASYQWINCDNNTQLNNQTNQSVVISANGRYAVIVDNGKCIDTSDCVEINSIGITDWPSVSALTVYPNPGVDRVYLSQDLPINADPIRIYNATYQLVAVEKYNVGTGISVGHLPAGFYWIAIPSTSGISRYIKWVKQE